MGHRLSGLPLPYFITFRYIVYINISLYVPHLWLLESWWKMLCILFPPILEPVSRKDCCDETLLSSYFFCGFFFCSCPHVLDTTSQPPFLASDCAPKFSSCNRRKVTSLQLCWEGCQHYQQKPRTGAFSCFITEWLWETAETLKPPVQRLRNEYSSNQYWSCFPLPQ